MLFACLSFPDTIYASVVVQVLAIPTMRRRSDTPVESTILKDEDCIVEMAVSAEGIYPHCEKYLYAHLISKPREDRRSGDNPAKSMNYLDCWTA